MVLGILKVECRVLTATFFHSLCIPDPFLAYIIETPERPLYAKTARTKVQVKRLNRRKQFAPMQSKNTNENVTCYVWSYYLALRLLVAATPLPSLHLVLHDLILFWGFVHHLACAAGPQGLVIVLSLLLTAVLCTCCCFFPALPFFFFSPLVLLLGDTLIPRRPGATSSPPCHLVFSLLTRCYIAFF